MHDVTDIEIEYPIIFFLCDENCLDVVAKVEVALRADAHEVRLLRILPVRPNRIKRAIKRILILKIHIMLLNFLIRFIQVKLCLIWGHFVDKLLLLGLFLAERLPRILPINLVILLQLAKYVALHTRLIQLLIAPIPFLPQLGFINLESLDILFCFKIYHELIFRFD